MLINIIYPMLALIRYSGGGAMDFYLKSFYANYLHSIFRYVQKRSVSLHPVQIRYYFSNIKKEGLVSASWPFPAMWYNAVFIKKILTYYFLSTWKTSLDIWLYILSSTRSGILFSSNNTQRTTFLEKGPIFESFFSEQISFPFFL